jgi:putative DNA primase/helicase
MVVYFDSVKSVQPKPFATNWVDLKERLMHHEENAHKSDGALWSPVEYYQGRTRGNTAVRFIEALVVDMDGESFANADLDGYEYLAYSTYSHRLDDPHYHLVLPLAEHVPAGLWRAIWGELHQRLNLQGDPATKDPARIFYLPQHAPDQPFEFHEQSGKFIDTNFQYEPATNPTPTSPRQSAQPRRKRTVRVEMDDAWWDAGEPSTRYAHLEGQAMWKAMADDFRVMVAEYREAVRLASQDVI